MTLGNRIKAARNRLGMTQEQLGDALGVTKQAVYRWEQDLDYPAGRVPKLRRTLRVTFSWLHGGEGPAPDPGDPAVIYEDLQADRYEEMRVLADKKRK